MVSERKIQIIYELGIVFFLFVLLTFIITFPLGIHLSSYLSSSHDTFANLWYFWWFKQALIQLHQLPLFTQFLYFPHGTTLFFETSWIHDLMILPFIICCGSITAFNILIFINFALTGTGFYLFIKELTNHRWSAFLGAFVFTFSTFRLYKIQSGHIDLLSTEWLGFYLFFLFRWARTQKSLYGLLAGIFLGLTAYTEYRIFIFVLLMNLPLFVFFTRKSLYNLRLLSLLKLTLAIFICVVPLLILHSSYLLTVQKIQTKDIIEENLTPDVLQFFLPNLTKIWIPKFFDEKLQHTENEAVYLGIILLLLAIIGLVSLHRDQHERVLKSIWFSITILFFVITLGPAPKFAGIKILPSFLWPYNIFLHLPILSFLRVPSRFIVIVQIGIALFVAYGFRHLYQLKPLKHSRVFVVVCCLLLFAEKLLFPFTFEEVYVPSLYASLERDSGHYTVLELQFGFLDGMYKPVGTFDPRVLFRQTIHKKYLITGYLSLTPRAVWEAYTADPTLAKVIECQENHCVNFLPEEKLKLLNYYQVRYLVFFPFEGRDRLIYFFKSNFENLSLVTSDEVTVIYRLD